MAVSVAAAMAGVFQSARPIWGASMMAQTDQLFRRVSIRTPHMGRVRQYRPKYQR